jgi:hypothetical protein
MAGPIIPRRDEEGEPGAERPVRRSLIFPGQFPILVHHPAPEFLHGPDAACQGPDGEKTMSQKSDQDNHANQCNPNHEADWESRGFDERPEDWKHQVGQEDEQ